MESEAIEKIQELVEAKTRHLVIAGKDYVSNEMKQVIPPAQTFVQVNTLAGLEDLLRAAPASFKPEEWFIQVVSPRKVVVERKEDDEYGRRPLFAVCELSFGEPFLFDKFLERDTFVIGLMSRFVQNADSQALLALTSSMSSDGAVLSEDDGVTQKVTVKQGVMLKDVKMVRPRWTLQPYRTFREVVQPASEFVFRVKGEPGSIPSCALFEADGGTWKLDAVLTIKQWLEAQALGLPVVA